MNVEKEKKMTIKNTAREIANLAVFVALVIAAQFALSFIAGVELVTVLFVTYAFTFGVRRGMLAATAFSLLRMLVFGVFLNVLALYLIYYNALAACFGILGRRVKKPLKNLWWLVLLACVCTLCFTLLDNLLTIVWYDFTKKAAKAYFIASLPVAFSQMLCTAITVGALFLPLRKILLLTKKG
jgi:hypothetical protein